MATAATVFRDYETDGLPASGKHKVKKPDVRQLLTGFENIITAFTSSDGRLFTSLASINVSLDYSASTMAWVIGDPVAANNGVYQKLGASGSGSWLRRADLPYSFIVASDAGAGTPNAVVATTSIPVSSSALVWMNIFEANTAGLVTVSFNGGSALTIKTNTGNDVSAGGLTAGMIVLGIVSGSTFRLLNDQVSSAIIAAAEDAADRAEAAASLLNYVTGYGSVDLTGVVSAQTVIQAAVDWSYANNAVLNWPNGLYCSTGNITHFHDVRHAGPGRIKRDGLDADIVVNGDFSSSTGWTFSGAGATIGGGVLTFPGTGSGAATKLIPAIKTLTVYEITYTIVSVSAGNMSFRLEGSTDVVGVNRSAAGTYTERLTSNATTVGIQFVSSATFNGVIDNLTVREVITSTFAVEPIEGQTNILYVAASGGSTTNDGLAPSQPRSTLQGAFDALKYYWPLNGSWRVRLAAGTYSAASQRTARLGPANEDEVSPNVDSYAYNGMLMRNAVVIEGPDVGYDPATAPTPVPTTIFEGGGAAAIGIQLESGQKVIAKNLKFQNYSGSSSSGGIIADGSCWLRTENVHADTCSLGLSAINHSRFEVKGGTINACGTGIRSMFGSKHEIGNQLASAAGQGPFITNCTGAGFLAQEGATGHSDFVSYADNAM